MWSAFASALPGFVRVSDVGELARVRAMLFLMHYIECFYYIKVRKLDGAAQLISLSTGTTEWLVESMYASQVSPDVRVSESHLHTT